MLPGSQPDEDKQKQKQLLPKKKKAQHGDSCALRLQKDMEEVLLLLLVPTAQS
jgi:hypothetical protein